MPSNESFTNQSQSSQTRNQSKIDVDEQVLMSTQIFCLFHSLSINIDPKVIEYAKRLTSAYIEL